jgi:TM2 domain-containing membrane protein YozV
MTYPYASQQPALPPEVNSRKILCGIMGILFGGLGIHRFILGDTAGGIIRIVITVVTCGIGSIIGLIEGILTKTDAEFYQTYMVEKKAWF